MQHNPTTTAQAAASSSGLLPSCQKSPKSFFLTNTICGWREYQGSARQANNRKTAQTRLKRDLEMLSNGNFNAEGEGASVSTPTFYNLLGTGIGHRACALEKWVSVRLGLPDDFFSLMDCILH